MMTSVEPVLFLISMIVLAAIWPKIKKNENSDFC